MPILFLKGPFPLNAKACRLLLIVWSMVAVFPSPAFSQHALLPEGFAEGKIVVIDPGHGGHDEGVRHPSGTSEKELALQLAVTLKDALHGTCRVHLTRDGDYWVDLERRTASANNRQADAFVSLHTGGRLGSTNNRAQVFHHVGNPEQPFFFADQGELDDGPVPALPMWHFVQSKHESQSRLLARSLRSHLATAGYASTRGILGAPLYVLKGADMAAVLVEIGGIDSYPEPRPATGENALTAVAEAIVRGLNDYFDKRGSCVQKPDMLEEDIHPGRGAVW